MMTNSLFQAPAFLDRSNIYEVNIRQYSPQGTFKAFAAHLPRLKDMGVEIIWLMPIHPIGNVKRKGILGSYYSISDYKQVNPEFGSKDDLANLIDHVHSLGMKIIFDVVANHTSWDHVWTKDHPEYFLRNEDGSFKVPFDWDDVIQIDHSNAYQQNEMIDVMRYWITEFDIDGFRADMAHLIPIDFWIKARTLLSPLKKDLIWLGETEEIEWHKAFDISYAWNWMHKTENYAKEKIRFADMLNVLAEYKTNFPENARHLFFTANHDENSWNGTEYEKYGNLAKAFAVFACTYNGIPLIYSGQELPNKKRLKFFEKDEIEWTEDISLHSFYKTLLALRKRNSAVFASGKNDLQIFPDTWDSQLLAYSLTKDTDSVVVFLNLGKNNISQYFTRGDIHGCFRDVFSGDEILIGENIFLNLKSGEFLVMEKVGGQGERQVVK